MSQIHKYSELIYGKELDKATIEEYLNVDYLEATRRWVASGHTDFSVYNDPVYLASIITSYFHLSAGTTRNAIFELRRMYPDCWTKLKVLDDYNGLGLSTRDFIKAGFNKAYFYNDVALQKEIFWKIINEDKLPVNKFVEDVDRSGRYDAVLSCEVLEHYKKPEEYLDEVLRLIKPRGLFIFSSGFANMHTGHFPEYEIKGKMVPIRKAGRCIKGLLEERGFERLNIKCWNGKPKFYQRV